MRVFISVRMLVLFAASPVLAQQLPVVVTTDTGEKLRGRLLSITDDTLTLTRAGQLQQIPLDHILTVVKPRDSVIDGLLKGIVIGAVPLLIWGTDGMEARYAARFVLTWGLVGLGVDAITEDSFVVYDKSMKPAIHPRAAALGWTVRF